MYHPKPDNISLKEWIIKMTSEELGIPEDIVEIVISDSYKMANRATRIENSVELSGFCTFFVSPSKVRIRVKKMKTYLQKAIENGLQTPEELERYNSLISSLEKRIDEKKTQHSTDNRGIQERYSSTQEP